MTNVVFMTTPTLDINISDFQRHTILVVGILKCDLSQTQTNEIVADKSFTLPSRIEHW